ncbi:MAG: AAA family ATPase [Clostridia bacterium]|nr:AAA family ATPase [Clostridia bacterium]
MIIQKIHINSFGPAVERDYNLASGINVLEGKNESGKTTIAMFIKFVLYGLSGRATEGGLSERKKYINWKRGAAAGYLTVLADGKKYRIERTLTATTDGEGKETYRDSVKILDLAAGAPVAAGSSPGEYFLGVPEDVFLNTVFIRQTAGTRVDADGATSAIENILFGADENVNTEKAMAALDKMRKQLLHKNGNGGLIYELTEEKQALTEQLKVARATSAEYIRLEGSYSDALERKRWLDEKMKELETRTDAYEVNSELNKFETVRKIDTAVQEINGRLAMLESGFGSTIPDGQSIRALDNISRVIERDIHAEREAELVLENFEAELKMEVPEEEMRRFEAFNGIDEFAPVDDVAFFSGKRHNVNGIGWMAGIAGAAAVAVTLIFKIIHTVWIPFVPIAGVGLLGAAIVCAILSRDYEKKIEKICEKNGVATVKELTRAIKRDNKRYLRYKELMLKRNQLRQAVKAAKDRIKEDSVRANTILSGIGKSVLLNEVFGEIDANEPAYDLLDVIAKAFNEAEDIYSRAQALIQERNILLGQRKLAESDISTLNERELTLRAEKMGVLGRVYTDEELTVLKREYDFHHMELRSMTVRIQEMEKKLAVLSATAEDPAELAGRLAHVEKRLAAAQKKYDAYRLAEETLEQATAGVRNGVSPLIAERARAMIAGATDGKYEEIGLSAHMDLTVLTEDGTKELEYFSGGTKDLAYVALRMALVEVLYKKELPPLIFDECFSQLDDERLCGIVDVIDREISADRQCLLLTSQRREAELFEGRFNAIRLGGGYGN